jgi:hypothetical protein
MRFYFFAKNRVYSKCPWCMLNLFLTLSIGLQASILLELLEYLCIIPFHVLSLLAGLGRTLEYFYVTRSLLSLG